jgi:prepilin-type N-terminal cleavage/methylation domain-containing protein
MKTPNPHAQSGFTLIEMLISTAISALVIAGVFALAAHETRLMSSTSDKLEVVQGGRAALDAIADDLRHAGAAIGDQDGVGFAGLAKGTVTIGGAAFVSQNRTLSLSAIGNGTYDTTTDDLVMMMALGNVRSVIEYDLAGTGQKCAGGGFMPNGQPELVVVRSPDGFYARTIVVDSIAAVPCGTATCIDGCESFTFTNDSTYVSGTTAGNFNYVSGEMYGQLHRVAWFVVATDPTQPGVGSLHRAIFDASHPVCNTLDHTCGDLMAEDVDSLQLQYWQWDEDANNWANVTDPGTPYIFGARIRVDVELVMRSRATSDRPQTPLALRLEPGACVPDCNRTDNYVHREVFRTSVEIKNSGRMVLR